MEYFAIPSLQVSLYPTSATCNITLPPGVTIAIVHIQLFMPEPAFSLLQVTLLAPLIMAAEPNSQKLRHSKSMLLCKNF